MELLPNDVKVLRAVRHVHGRCGAIAKAANVSYGGTETTLQRLKRKGLIVYNRGKGAHWALTPQGLATVRDLAKDEINAQ